MRIVFRIVQNFVIRQTNFQGDDDEPYLFWREFWIMSQVMDYDQKLERILNIDENIRYATVSDMEGNQIASKKRENAELYLSPEETRDTLLHAASAWKSRTKHYDKIGKGLYTLAVYEKLRRVTIPLKSRHLLLVTIDNKGGQKQIVDKILNEVIVGDYTDPNY